MMSENMAAYNKNARISLYINEHNFEYDMQTLLMAFFPNIPVDIYAGCGSAYERAGIKDSKTEEANIILRADVKFLYDGEDDNVFVTLIKDESVLKDSAKVDFSDRKDSKNKIKLLMYGLLTKLTDKTLPWGTLTGIRPVKIAENLIDTMDDDALRNYLKETYRPDDKKIELSLLIAHREKKIIDSINKKNGYSVYIGIPFCPTTCLYCSFTSYPISAYKKIVPAYLDALKKEIDYVAFDFFGREMNSIYIGGGTPTTLEPDELEILLSYIRQKLDFTYCKEFTVEAGRPDSITKEKLMVLKKYGVTRISVNPQTMQQKTLDLIGRRHTVSQVKEAFYMARELGFDNINMDFIVGLPNETYEDVKDSMEQVLLMKPESVTIHSLAIKRTSRLNINKKEYEDVMLKNNEAIMDMTGDYVSKLDLKPYYLYRQKNMAGNMENVGYALPGKEGIYNMLIMEEVQDIVALGAGSACKRVFEGGRIERCENVKEVAQYIDRIDEMIDRKKVLYGED